MKTMIRLWLALAVLLGLSACNTIEGVGEDLSAGARAIDRAI